LTNPLRDIILKISQRGFVMEVTKFSTYRSKGRGVNKTNDRARITIDCSINEYRRHFKSDPLLKKLEIVDIAIEVCKKIDKFHFEVFCSGRPLMIDGKLINHSILNEAYDLAYKVLQQIKE